MSDGLSEIAFGDLGSTGHSERIFDESGKRIRCWICGSPIKPDKAPRALCGPCACIPDGGMRS